MTDVTQIFSNLVPPEQRKSGVESTQDVFVTHRQRQKVRAYQDKMEIRTLQSLAYFHVCCFYAFLTNAEADGSLDKVGIAAAVFALVSCAYNMQYTVHYIDK